MKLNRWVYMVIVVIVSIAAGFAIESRNIVALGGFVLLLPVLTFPLGVVGSLCALPLIFLGIATPSEAYTVAAPIFALAGMVQWYVLLPRFIAKRSNLALESDGSDRGQVAV